MTRDGGRHGRSDGAVKLADFIEASVEPILADWIAFARTRPAGHEMDDAERRDHAAEMLRAIVAHLRSQPTDSEESRRSDERGDSADGSQTAAEEHGSQRAESGFTVGEIVSEYRALRASVIRLWTNGKGIAPEDVTDVVRFSEAIDDAIAESVTQHAEEIDRSKKMFLAILGHDLRSPLSAVIGTSQIILETEKLEEPHRALLMRNVRSAQRMNQMIGDLLDFVTSRLGEGIPITRGEMDLATAAKNVADEIRAAHPDRPITVQTSGELRGRWDAARINQVLANLLGNAIHHGEPKSEIRLNVRGESSDVVLEVHNHGTPIPESERADLFVPMKKVERNGARQASEHLGLGLYIVDRIVAAHKGRIDVESNDQGTRFTVRLPR
jgi:signal transduction histidine kinase